MKREPEKEEELETKIAELRHTLEVMRAEDTHPDTFVDPTDRVEKPFKNAGKSRGLYDPHDFAYLEQQIRGLEGELAILRSSQGGETQV